MSAASPVLAAPVAALPRAAAEPKVQGALGDGVPQGTAAPYTPPPLKFCASGEELGESLIAALGLGGEAPRESRRGPGVLHLRGLPIAAPDWGAVHSLFQRVAEEPSLGERANTAYTRNLVWKDSYGTGKGGPSVDEKRVIDLSPSRLETIVSVDPELAEELGQPLEHALSFFDGVRRHVAPSLLRALAHAVGDPSIARDGCANYRLVDYNARRPGRGEAGPRCGEHRDFGTLTLIFADGVSGLQVMDGATWRPVDTSHMGPGDALLLFGWCATVRANDRVPAAMHRVVDAPPGADGLVPRRSSAVFFLAPEPEQMLTPVLREGEDPNYRPFTAGDLKHLVGRKWRWREGTLSNKDAAAEADEAARFPDQDAIISHRFRV